MLTLTNGADRDRARTKLEDALRRGTASAGAVVERVLSVLPEDSIVRGTALGFAVPAPGVIEMAAGSDHRWSLHPHARAQAADRAGIPTAYVDKLAAGDEWQRQLLAHTLNQSYGNIGGKYLLRAVPTPPAAILTPTTPVKQVRGFLSDKFRRLDCRPILDRFVESAQAMGAVPYAGAASDLRVALTFVLPEVREVLPGEYLVHGVRWSNSDYGTGANVLAEFSLRLLCLNGMTGEDVARQVHLGRQLDENIEFSRRTYELDTRTAVSAMGDVVRAALGTTKRAQIEHRISSAGATAMTDASLRGRLAKSLTKDEMRRAAEAFNGPDCENLPAGQTTWRASNALSFLAQAADVTTERRMELERLAGSILRAA